jgi:L-2,4-diaminobutyric acid acetyltransferase
MATAAFVPSAAPELILRPPRRQDGAAIHAVVAACPPLDLNSRYAYLLLCRQFANTCVIAEQNGVAVGAITAYFPPLQSDTLFVWQVAVASHMRGQRLGTNMLQHLLQRCMQSRRLRWVETTISPSNHPSQKLFTGFARQHGIALSSTIYFAADDFGESDHDEECLYRIGPWG